MLKTESYRKGIVYSVFFNFVARGIAFLNALAIAFYFGNNSTTDLYFYILSFVTIVTSFINGMDTFVLIPESMRLRHQASEKESMQFLNFFFYLYILLGVIISLVIAINPVSFYDLISKFGYQQLSDNASLLYMGILLILLVLITNLQTSIFTSQRYFTMPMIVSVVNNILSFVMIVLLHKQFGLKSGIIGMIAGYLLNFFFLVYFMKKRLGWNFGFKKIRLQKQTGRNLLFLQASNVFLYVRNYISVYVLSGLPAGTVTSYNYGQQLASIPESMVVNQFGSVAGIKMNELHAQRQYEKLNELFLEASKALMFLLFPLGGLIFLYAEEIVQVLYGRGKFDAAAVAEVSRFLKFLALLLPMSALMGMAAKIFTAFQKVGVTFYYNVLVNLFLIILILVGTHYYGVMGYLFASIIGYFAVIFLLYFLLKYNISTINYLAALLFFFKILLINATVVIFIIQIRNLFPLTGFHIIVSTFLGGIVYIGLLFFLAKFVGVKHYFTKKAYFN